MFKALTIHYSPLTKKMQRSKKIEMLHFSLLTTDHCLVKDLQSLITSSLRPHTGFNLLGPGFHLCFS
jgi:hypothetical protein